MSNFTDLGCCILEACKCAFGEKVRYLPKAGGTQTFIGIFDNQFEQVDPDTEVVIASNQVTLGIRLDDLKSPPQKGDRVIVRKKEYHVIDSQEDGVCGATLFLHEVC